LGIVVLVTAHFTGGISFRTSGSEIYGGKRYFYVLGAIIGFFSFIAQRPALTQVRWYLPVFLLSGITATLSNISPMIGPPWNLVSLFFPADPISQQMFSNNVTAGAFMDIIRFGPLAVAAQSLFLFLLAHYGVKQLFILRHWWRLLLLLCSFAVGLLGGFRSYMIFMVLTFGVLFWIEGLWRTRLFPALVLAILLGGALIVPFADKLPMSIQRSLSVLPIKIDPIAQLDAEGSTEWRLQMWKILLPEVSQHLILGKGYSIKSQDLELAQTAVVMHGGDTADVALLAGDYHNGPLSVILPFGIFGSVGFLWLIAAGLRVVLKNYSNGDPEFKRTNTFLLAYYIAKTLFFFTVFGSFYSDLFQFTGLIGLSISLNGGICGKAAEPQPKFTYARFPLARASH
jgi:O-antigen ligase